MSNHPLNLVLRFALEIAGLIAMGYWGFRTGQGAFMRFLLGSGVPLLAAVLWGVFRVPDDPGSAPVAVPGVLRLILELAFFGFAVWALNDAGARTLGWALGLVVLAHYLISYDRVAWLIRQ